MRGAKSEGGGVECPLGNGKLWRTYVATNILCQPCGAILRRGLRVANFNVRATKANDGADADRADDDDGVLASG
eukprot:6724924-Pyramimonas_sp.AAC.1